MKLSKSKRQLAELLIAAGVKQFPKGANWVAQDKEWDGHGKCALFYKGRDKPCVMKGASSWIPKAADSWLMHEIEPIQLTALIPNWHQTLLSRDEFDTVAEESLDLNQYCESVKRSIPEQPTLDQLLSDWRNAAEYAARKRVELDEATAMRDQRWQAVQERAQALSVSVASGAQK